MSTQFMADKMQKELSSLYNQLHTLQMDQHARDFWRIRAAKQQEQVLQNALLHEHTAITQYVAWHSQAGARLPTFARGSEKCLAKIFKSG
jgi:hypothetical protein